MNKTIELKFDEMKRETVMQTETTKEDENKMISIMNIQKCLSTVGGQGTNE